MCILIMDKRVIVHRLVNTYQQKPASWRIQMFWLYIHIDLHIWEEKAA